MEYTEKLLVISRELALAALKIKAIKIRPDNPFTWASGWKSPIYNNNRRFLFYPEYRRVVIDGFVETLRLLKEVTGYKPDIIAGTSTAGIPHGYGLAERLALPFIYVREKAKDHGMENRIEGIDGTGDLQDRNILLIEDLISTGGSSASAVQAIRDEGGNISLCFSIFSYGFPKAKEMFEGKASFLKDDWKNLSLPCYTKTILEYPDLIRIAIEKGYIEKQQQELLENWSKDPEKWSNDFKAKELQKG